MLHKDLDARIAVVDALLKNKFSQAAQGTQGRWKELAAALGELAFRYGARRDVQDKIVQVLGDLSHPDQFRRILGLAEKVAAQADKAANMPHSPLEFRELMNLEESMVKIYHDTWRANDDMAANRRTKLLDVLEKSSSGPMRLLGQSLSADHPLKPIRPGPG